MKNKKKIRGWPRQVKKLDKYASEMLIPNLIQYEKYGFTYGRFFIDPWYRLIKRNPPTWFFKVMIRYLDLAFDEWEKTFSNLNKPYDLQIWLFSSAFVRSEIYCAKVDDLGERRDLFTPSTIQKSFPDQIFGLKIKSKLEWTLYDDFSYFEEEEFLEMFGDGNISNKKYNEHFRSDGSKYYTFKLGEVWVGRTI